MRFCLCALLMLASGSALAADGEWISLFNGKNLDGWKANKEGQFTVKNGVIRVNGSQGHLFYVDRSFNDFVFECDVKTTPGSNSGIYIHTAYQEEGWPRQGMEVQVNVSHTDPVRSGSLYNRVEIFEVPIKDHEWYTCRVKVVGNSATVSINGKPLFRYKQPDSLKTQPMLSEGLFALQAHDPNSVVYYRNIRVKPLNEGGK